MSLTRRTALTLAATASLAPGVVQAAAAVDAPHPELAKSLSRIAFGSCAKQSKDQPIWEAVVAAKPDLFVFLGDNIYADTRDMAVVKAKYAELAAKPGFQRLRETTPVCAIWDDHDYGEDDAGADYPMKDGTRAAFCDFWGEPADSPRRSRDGIYASYLFGPRGRRVQLIMPDLRWNRTPLRKIELGGADYWVWAGKQAAAGKPVPGPYERIPDQDATMLGETQWTWLEAQLRVPADLRILCSSLQILADFAGWEAWVNYARDQARLFQAIRDAKAERLVCISGDTHYAEVSLLDVNTPYPIWDITSSGLTEVWPVTPPNALRQGEVLRERNFGMIEIDWSRRAPVLKVEIRDEKGQVRLTQAIDTATLRIG